MKIQIMSDLHFEMHADGGAELIRDLDPTGVDVLVLAGDITTARQYADLESVFSPLTRKYRHILYVPGNHEYYKSSPREVARNLAKLIVRQLVLLGPAAASFVSPLVVRFDRTSGEPEETGAIIKILTAVGPSAVPALPSLVRVLGDRKRVSLWRPALAAIGSIGPGAASAKPAALDVLSEASTFIRPVAEALLRINARLDRKEFSQLDDAFQGICGSILSTEAPVHEQNAECSAAAAAIGRIASAGGHPISLESR